MGEDIVMKMGLVEMCQGMKKYYILKLDSYEGRPER